MKVEKLEQKLPYLIVDDSGIQRQVLCKALYSLGISNVVQAENGLEALEFLHNSKFELVISDLQMRGMDGYELLQKLRQSEEHSEVPFIVISAENEDNTTLQAIMMLADTYIKKPVNSEEIANAIKKVLEKQKQIVNLDANILIVDDISSARKIARKYLSQMGFSNFKEASSAKEAIKEVYKGEVNIILTDWSMPEVDGIEMIKILKSSEATKSIPIIMISSFSERARVLEAAEAGAASFISKPYNAQLIYERVAEVSVKNKPRTPTSTK